MKTKVISRILEIVELGLLHSVHINTITGLKSTVVWYESDLQLKLLESILKANKDIVEIKEDNEEKTILLREVA